MTHNQTGNGSLPSRFSANDEHRKLSHEAFKAGMKFLAESLGLIDSQGNTEIPPNQIAAYEIILRDMPDDAFRWAVYSLASSHRFPKLPTAGNIREKCVEYLVGEDMPGLLAWNHALHYLQQRKKFWNEFDGWRSESYRKEFIQFMKEKVDPELTRIIGLIGWKELKNSQKQFLKLWDESLEMKRERLMKPPGYSQAQQKRISQKGKELTDESKAT
jgi:hypothetical protein